MTEGMAPTPAPVCATCHQPTSAANLTTLPGGTKRCPSCGYAAAVEQVTHQVLARPAGRAHAEHGLRVEDVPRGMAARLAALARRRSA